MTAIDSRQHGSMHQMYLEIRGRMADTISSHVSTIGFQDYLTIVSEIAASFSEDVSKLYNSSEEDAKQYRAIANALKALADNTPEDI